MKPINIVVSVYQTVYKGNIEDFVEVGKTFQKKSQFI